MKQTGVTAALTALLRGNRLRANRAPAIFSAVLVTLFLAGCSSAPKDYWGRWKPVNRYEVAPTAIPLNATYVYYPTPMDQTLRSMLRRWAKDSGMQFSYQLQSDFTITQRVASIQTTDVHRALASLNDIYGAQGVQVYALNNEIIAKPLSVAVSPGTDAADNPGTDKATSTVAPSEPSNVPANSTPPVK